MKNSKRLVQGVGINDAGYFIERKEIIDGRLRLVWACPFYRAWKDMLVRSYSVRLKSKYPTYSECYVVPEWHRFSVFRSWMESQDWKGNDLDKDILYPGNKVYGPNTCVFVPSQINTFLCDCALSRGDFPIGVFKHRISGKFHARCRNPFNGKREHLGNFSNPEEAHEAWRKRKHEHACRYADMQTDQRIANALRVRYAGGQK